MSSPSTSRNETSIASPAGVFSSVLGAAVGAAATKLERKVGRWIDKLDGGGGGGSRGRNLPPAVDAGLDAVEGRGGAAQAAAAEGVKAYWQGNNPVWAAVHGAWTSGTPAVKAAIIAAVAAAILLVLVSPVLCLVFLLSLLVLTAIHHADHAKT